MELMVQLSGLFSDTELMLSHHAHDNRDMVLCAEILIIMLEHYYF